MRVWGQIRRTRRAAFRRTRYRAATRVAVQKEEVADMRWRAVVCRCSKRADGKTGYLIEFMRVLAEHDAFAMIRLDQSDAAVHVLRTGSPTVCPTTWRLLCRSPGPVDWPGQTYSALVLHVAEIHEVQLQVIFQWYTGCHW